jgi:hypothetical protein
VRASLQKSSSPAPLQQKTQLEQDLKAELSDVLMQLDTLDSKGNYYLETRLASGGSTRSAKISSYAVENITNLLNSIDLELTL